MLRLLLCVTAVSQLTGATQVDISSCPLPYFGKLSHSLFVNSSAERVSVCFEAADVGSDCLLLAYGGISSVQTNIVNGTAGAGSDFQQALPELTGSSPCSVTLSLRDATGTEHVVSTMRPFDEQAAMSVYLSAAFSQNALEVDVWVGGASRRRWTFTEKNQQLFRDMSGCRHAGAVFDPDTAACDSAGSSVVTCSPSASLSVSPCGSGQHCGAGGRCVLRSVCTVTGPSVISFGGGVTSIVTRCAYTLLSAPGLQLVGAFRERRRRDVSFLDHVTLHLDGPDVDIELGQGGTVQLGDATLSLSSSAQLVHGVALSRDTSGVTAEATVANVTVSIFFDGTTAQISMTGPGPLSGLCGASGGAPDEAVLSDVNSSRCDSQSAEAPDPGINCTTATERSCDLLREAPFTSCHSLVDPEPFISACSTLLCKYPAVDGLYCQSQEDYARACSLYSSDTLQGWRAATGCSPPHGFCQDVSCSAHEFCGDAAGQPLCLCRADFSAEYKAKGVLGETAVCRGNSASVSLPSCLLVEKGVDVAALRLNDDSCPGHMDNETHMLTFGFDSSKPCGAVVSAAGGKITYSNAIQTANRSSKLISRQDKVHIDFSCFYSQPLELNDVFFSVKGGSAMQQMVGGSWNYSLKLQMCSDFDCTKPIDMSKGLKIGQNIYFSIVSDNLDGNLITLTTQSCSATNGASGIEARKYSLVENGCGNPNDNMVKVMPNGKGTGSVLQFQMFQFKGSSGKVFLSCKMKLCLKSDRSCLPKCPGNRKRRSVRRLQEDEDTFLVSASWNT